MEVEKKDVRSQEKTASGLPRTKISRREFLKIAGAAGAAVGLGAGLGGLAAGCGEEETTTTAAQTTTTAAQTTTTVSATTTVNAGAETGRELLIGYVTPQSGALGAFGKADKYCVERWEEAVAGGMVCGDGKNHPIKFLFKDSQSDTNRAAQVTADLVLNDKVDIMMAASTPETTNPVADQCETLAVPCYTVGAPWQAYFFGRGAADPEVGFKWTYHHFWGLEDIVNIQSAVWDRIETNKIVGAMWPNDSDGAAFADPVTGFPAVMPELGYTLVDPGLYPNGLEDFTAQISLFKKEGCEIITGVPIPPDFTTFWKQCMQQGFNPKVATIAKAVDLPPDVEALGDAFNHFCIEMQWSPRWQFTSSLTGETCQQIADEFENRVGMQWGSYLMFYAAFEVVADALKRCADVEDKEVFLGALATTKLTTVAGPVDFTAPIAGGTLRPAKNVCRSPLVTGQWVEGTKYKYELVAVDNSNYPDIAVEAELRELAY